VATRTPSDAIESVSIGCGGLAVFPLARHVSNVNFCSPFGVVTHSSSAIATSTGFDNHSDTCERQSVKVFMRQLFFVQRRNICNQCIAILTRAQFHVGRGPQFSDRKDGSRASDGKASTIGTALGVGPAQERKQNKRCCNNLHLKDLFQIAQQEEGEVEIMRKSGVPNVRYAKRKIALRDSLNDWILAQLDRWVNK